MKSLALLFIAGIALAQPPPAFVAGTPATASAMNTTLTDLYNRSTHKFSGSGVPGSITYSTRGDIYINTANDDFYVCDTASPPCTSVASNNWVKVTGAGGGGSTPGGSSDDIQVNASGSLAGGRGTLNSSGVLTIAGTATALGFASSDTTHSGIDYLKGKTSGGVAWAVADVAGTAITYILPATNGAANQFLADTGSTTCPTLPAAAPSTCHLLAWSAVTLSGAQVSGNLGVTHLNSGTGATSSTFFRGDGTWATPAGGGTIASTTSALKGDGSGNASAVTGTGSNCVHVDGSSASCPGGGASIASTTSTIKGDGAGNGVAVTGTGTNCVLVNGSSTACSAATVPSPLWLPAGACNGAGQTGLEFWSANGASNSFSILCPNSATGFLGAEARFSNNTKTASFSFPLLSATTDIILRAVQQTGGTGDVGFQLETTCGTSYGTPSWNAAQQTNTRTVPTINTIFTYTVSTITTTGCSVNDIMYVRVSWGSGATFSGEFGALGAEVVFH